MASRSRQLSGRKNPIQQASSQLCCQELEAEGCFFPLQLRSSMPAERPVAEAESVLAVCYADSTVKDGAISISRCERGVSCIK